MNNFYNEPPFAKRLLELSKQEQVPETTQEEYVKIVVMAYIGNGFGVSRAAIPYYSEMIEGFSPREVSIMLHLPKKDRGVKNRISANASCKKRFIEAVKMLDAQTVPRPVKAIYEAIVKD